MNLGTALVRLSLLTASLTLPNGLALQNISEVVELRADCIVDENRRILCSHRLYSPILPLLASVGVELS